MKDNIIKFLFSGFFLVCANHGAYSQEAAVPSGERIDLTLEMCRQMALDHSEDLKKAGNALQQAELDRKIAGTAYLPNISASATGAYMLPDMDVMGMDLIVRGCYMAGLSLTQPIYAGGKIVSGRRLSSIGQDVSREQERMARADVIAQADEAYWTYVAVLKKVKMMQSYCAMMDTLSVQVSASSSAGMAVDNDILKVQARRSELIYQMGKASSGAELCRLALCNIIGADGSSVIVPADTALSVSAPSTWGPNISSRPELRLLEKQVEADEQMIRMTRADFLPSIGLSIGYTYFGNIRMRSFVDTGSGPMPVTQEFRDGIGLAMLGVKIPIFHWGEGRKKVRKARLDLENSRLDLEKNTRLLGIEARQAEQNLTDGYMLISAAEAALDQASENLRVTSDRYGAGMASLSDLMDAQSQWQQSSSNLIEAKTQYKIYETAYLKATGRL